MISKCSSNTDANQKELVSHGTIQFPLACYYDDIEKNAIAWHWHDEFEIIVCTSGKAILNMVQNKITLKNNDAVFINSRALHSLEKSNGKIKSIVFNSKIIYGTNESGFYKNLILPFLKNTDFLFFKLQKNIDWQEKIINYTKTIWNKTQKEETEFQNDCRYFLTKIFYLMIEKCPALKNNPAKTNTFAFIQNERVKKMISFIENNYSSEITLDEISANAAVSKSVVLRDFNSILKTSPLQYIKKVRIEKACEMLSSTKEKISTIALNCGFNDMSYFSKSFKEQMKITPEEFRKSCEFVQSTNSLR